MAFDIHHVLPFLKRYQRFVVAGVVCLLLLIALVAFLNKPLKNTAQQDMILTIPEMGGLPALYQAMKENGRVRSLVKQLLEMDELTLFTDYKNVDILVTELLFYWSGFDAKEIKTLGKQKLAEVFIRQYYQLPPDEPIKNNPMFGKRPWYGLFQDHKAKILMQGQGHKIFEGVAYYDSRRNKMMVQGGLSYAYLDRLADFVKTQDPKTHRGLINNYLFFIDNTLGLKNLNTKEREKLKQVGFIR